MKKLKLLTLTALLTFGIAFAAQQVTAKNDKEPEMEKSEHTGEHKGRGTAFKACIKPALDAKKAAITQIRETHKSCIAATADADAKKVCAKTAKTARKAAEATFRAAAKACKVSTTTATP